MVKSNIRDITGQDKDAPEVSSPIPCPKCGKNFVKPDTVLYGGSLPDAFHTNLQRAGQACDLCIVTGTSLTVHPAAGVPDSIQAHRKRLGKRTPVVVVNMEEVGEFDFSKGGSDVFIKGYADDGFMLLAHKLGWLDDFEKYPLSERCKFALAEFRKTLESSNDEKT